MLATSLVLCAAVWMAVAEQEYEAFAFGAEAGADSSRCRFRCSIVLTVRADAAHKPNPRTLGQLQFASRILLYHMPSMPMSIIILLQISKMDVTFLTLSRQAT
jgi:hypothetical protein